MKKKTCNKLKLLVNKLQSINNSKYIKNINSEQKLIHVGFYEIFKGTVYSLMDIFKCCFDKEKIYYYKFLGKEFTRQLSCEEILLKVQMNNSVISKLLDLNSD